MNGYHHYKGVATMTTPALLTVEYLPIGDLKPDPFNPRRISDEELETLTRSIQAVRLGRPRHRAAHRPDRHRRPPALGGGTALGLRRGAHGPRRSFARAGPPP